MVVYQNEGARLKNQGFLNDIPVVYGDRYSFHSFYAIRVSKYAQSNKIPQSFTISIKITTISSKL
jgi:hypothetical protein